jgi:ParB family chromosome partitioning protein
VSSTDTTPTANLVHTDPAAMIVGANVRLDPRVDKEFLASIRERGVLQPVVAYRDDDEHLVVVFGQRRTVAAVQTGRPTIPVMVITKPAEGDRLVDQVVENDHRAGLTAGERVTAYEQLAAVGVSAAQIAKRTATKRADVDRALRIGGSTLARAAIDRYDFLTLDQGATVAEFEDDAEAVKTLVVAAKQGGFEHAAQRLRDARAEATARAEAVAVLVEAGMTVIERPDYDNKTIKGLRQLARDGEELTEDNHAGCPGHAAYVEQSWIYPGADDSDGDDPDDEEPDDAGDPAEQGRPYRAWLPQFVCTDYAAHGHTLRWAGHDSGSAKTPAAEMTDEQREAARAQRRDVIQSNKDWDSAETVRRQWLRGFLTRKTAPKTAAAFIAGSLAHTDHALTQALTNGHKLGHDLLGLGEQAPTYGRRAQALADLLATAGDARAQMIALGLVLAAYEEATGRHTWRNVHAASARYLHFLQTNGYELSTVELRACGEPPAPPQQ